MVDTLVALAERIQEDGIDAVLATAKPEAKREAERTREQLLQVQGADANHAAEKIERIREVAD
jgi:hypothetical protein